MELTQKQGECSKGGLGAARRQIVPERRQVITQYNRLLLLAVKADGGKAYLAQPPSHLHGPAYLGELRPWCANPYDDVGGPQAEDGVRGQPEKLGAVGV